jgi:hypothetical protein
MDSKLTDRCTDEPHSTSLEIFSKLLSKRKPNGRRTNVIREISRYQWSSLPGYLDGKRKPCYSGLKQRMIGERFAGLDEKLVSRDCKAIREKIETEPKIRKWFQDLAPASTQVKI